MNPSSSFIKTVLDRMRVMVDEPDVDARYTDDFLLRHCVMPSMVDVYSRLNSNSDLPIVNRFAVTLAAGQRYYQLPPCIQEVWRLVTLDETGNITGDWYPRHQMHPSGPGWSLEGNTLVIDPPIVEPFTLHVFYVPNGDFFPHYAVATSANLSFAADGVTHRLELMATPTMGVIDRRENAYTGAVVRVLDGNTEHTIEERIISAHSYDPATNKWYIEVRQNFTRHAVGDILTYEIAPAGSQPLYEAIATEAAMKLGVFRKVSQEHMQRIMLMHRASMKTIKDNVANFQLRTGKSFSKNTVDNAQFMLVS